MEALKEYRVKSKNYGGENRISYAFAIIKPPQLFFGVNPLFIRGFHIIKFYICLVENVLKFFNILYFRVK